MTSSPAPVLRPPRQARSRKTLDRIADAALTLIAEKGLDGITIAQVVSAAKSSVGSFYARFGGKEDLVRYLEDRVWSEAGRRWDSGIESGEWTKGPIERIVQELVGLLIALETEDAGRRAALGSARGPAWLERGRAFHRRAMAEVQSILMPYSDQIDHPDPELAIGVGYRIVLAGIRELVGDFSDPSVGPDPTPLRTELTRCYVGYLGAGPRGRRNGFAGLQEAGDPFDIWG